MKFLKHILIIFLGTYVVLILYSYFFQKKLIFYPTKTYTPPPAHLTIEEIFIPTPDGERLYGWWMAPDAGEKVVLYFNGNAGNLTDRTFRLEMFNNLGLGALLFDYRGYGKSTGKIQKEQDLYVDGLAVWEFLTKDKNILPADIILWGRSLGGAVATEIAQHKDVAALILEATFFTLPEVGRHHFWYLPVKTLLKFRFENSQKINNIKVPVLIIHSRQDEIIPFSQGEKLFKIAPQPKVFLELSGSHNTDIFESYEVYIKGLQDFIRTNK